jgi:hypothetical protein
MVNGKTSFYLSSKEAHDVVHSLVVAEGESHINRAVRILKLDSQKGRKRIMKILSGNAKMEFAEWKTLNEVIESEQ